MSKKIKMLGKFSPWVWSVEFVRGCNLKCWHCTARIFPEDHIPRFMKEDTWRALCSVINAATPYGRLELAQGGEPTLHPHLLEYLRIAKRITPTTQIQVTTNGLTLLSGEISFQQLFEAGANSVYVDMYGQPEKFYELARKSGSEWYKYDKPKIIASSPNHRMANTFYGDPKMRLIILQDYPEERIRWRRMGRLSTFLNHIEWDVAIPYGLIPVRSPYKRKCTMPMRYSSTSWEGDYIFCCIDFWCETAGLMGNVKDGVNGFLEFWFGRLMQSIRRRIIEGDRASVPYCSRCNCAFSKCDFVKIWPFDVYKKYWNGSGWIDMPSLDHDKEIFADGWKIKSAIDKALPSVKEESRILIESKKRIIKSDAALKIKDCK